MAKNQLNPRSVVIELDYTNVQDALFLLNNLNSVLLNKANYTTKHLSARMQLNGESLSFVEPVFETINGTDFMIIKSSI